MYQKTTSYIRQEITQTYKNFRSKYPILKHQNAIGFSIFALSVIFSATISVLWLNNMVSTWLLVVVNAFLFGVLHELEHDLIHYMYFKNNKIVHNLLLLFVWLLRPLTLNPWFRRTLHFHHHRFSGTLHDIEERGVTNGEKWGIIRFLFTPDLVLGNLIRVRKLFADIKQEVANGNLKIEVAHKIKQAGVFGLIPITIVSHLILYLFSIQLILNFLDVNFGLGIYLPEQLTSLLTYLSPLIYIILIPNLLRQFCLHLVTSNLHYFGDVEKGNVVEQTQVINVWWTFPLQFFCFFFGWTHAIHHFVVNETFYVRHLTRKKAHQIMRASGVRFNDLASIKRANRFHKDSKI
ncbi:fatty acid desaturase [Flavobacterium agricola]|uniref:Fatty acid desaturase n=1 Tax=Flavobacterium agricola TaxID=2870839 RepID=A0ABY6M3X0_9FLAO|nr:fatty acid desaturase [Flavobacterium agricola]UYW02499.1 fatty acid desaturase [Flavobacterium agricola]